MKSAQNAAAAHAGAGSPPDQRFDAADDPRLAGPLEEYLAALEAGERPDRDTLLARYPDLKDKLSRLIDGLEFVHQVAPQLRSHSGGAEDESSVSVGATPKALGEYRILREIGRGGMGVVYEAQQISLGRRVALKVLPFAAMMDHRRLARFRNEAQAAALLTHQHIVPVYSVGSSGGVHYYAMQFIDGCTLGDLIAQLRNLARKDPRNDRPAAAGLRELHAPTSDTVSYAQAVISTVNSHTSANYVRSIAELAVRIGEALDYAHRQGVIHRDIKPSNLLLDTQGEPWITDFGLARVEADGGMTMTGDLVGTLRYMSPEQALAQRVVVDHRTDIYSLGATLYELFTLEPAFPAEDRQELLHDIAFCEPTPPHRLQQSLPADLETIILKAMSKSPTERYATAQEMADDLRRFVENKPIRARRPSLLQRAHKWSRRHAAIVRVGLAAMVLVAVAGTAAAVLTLGAYRAERRQRANAEANLVLAAESVDRMLARVVGSRHNHGDLSDAAKVTAEATDLYERLLRNSNNPDFALRAARAYAHVASIQGQLFQDEAMEGAYARAVELLAPLAQAYPDRADCLDALAEALLNHGKALCVLDQRAAAERPFRQALAICEQLTKRFPGQEAYQYRLTQALHDLATVAQSAEAEALIHREIAVGLKLPHRIQELPESQSLQADALHEHALLDCRAEDYDGAIRALKEAIRLQGCAHLGWPTNQTILDRFAEHHISLAEAYLLAGQPAGAAATVEDLIDALPDRLLAYSEGARLLVHCARILPDETSRSQPGAEDAAGQRADITDASESARQAYLRRARELSAQAATARIRAPADVDRFARFLLTCPDESFRNPAQALQLAQEIVKEYPRRSGFWFTKSLAHYRLGELDNAEAELRKNAHLQVDAADLLLLALVRWHQGRHDDARAANAKAQILMSPQKHSDDVLMTLAGEAQQELKSDTDPARP